MQQVAGSGQTDEGQRSKLYSVTENKKLVEMNWPAVGRSFFQTVLINGRQHVERRYAVWGLQAYFSQPVVKQHGWFLQAKVYSSIFVQ